MSVPLANVLMVASILLDHITVPVPKDSICLLAMENA